MVAASDKLACCAFLKWAVNSISVAVACDAAESTVAQLIGWEQHPAGVCCCVQCA